MQENFSKFHLRFLKLSVETSFCQIESESFADFPELDNDTDPRGNEDQKASALLAEVEENDGLTECPPDQCPGRESCHVCSPRPERYVVLEGQEIEKEVNGGHNKSHGQQSHVRVSKYA